MRSPTIALMLAIILGSVAGFPSPGMTQLPEEPHVIGHRPPAVSAHGTRTGPRRLIVATHGQVTQTMLEQIGASGTVHGVIHRYNLVAVTPKGPNGRRNIEALPFVTRVEDDQPRFLADVGHWDTDIIDAVDVQESGIIGNPDPREVTQSGAGVHVAVIDTGLIRTWREFLPEERVRADLARAFMGGGATADDFVPVDEFHASNPANLWERDTVGHGLAVAAHVIGFKVPDPTFLADGVAPGALIVPLKVFPNGLATTFSSRIIAAIEYVTGLKQNGVIGPTVINLSTTGDPSVLERMAIQDAIAAGVIVVAAAGNSGELGMGWPAAYPEVISVGAVGWTRQFLPILSTGLNTSFWINFNVGNDPDGVSPSLEALQSYVVFFSGRAIPDLGTSVVGDPQELDVVAPGVWTVAPFRHGPQAGLFFLAGTSFSTPLVAAVAALMLEKNPTLTQPAVETILKATALPLPAADSRANIQEPFFSQDPALGISPVYSPSWDTDCGGQFCDAVGAGLVQADGALAGTP